MMGLSNKSFSDPMEPFAFRNAFPPASLQNGLFYSRYSLFCWLTLTQLAVVHARGSPGCLVTS